MTPRPCPPQPTSARFSLLLAAVALTSAPDKISGRRNAAAPRAAAEILRKLRREELLRFMESPENDKRSKLFRLRLRSPHLPEHHR